MKSCFIEWKVGMGRAGHGDMKHGMPYKFVFTVTRIGTTAYIECACENEEDFYDMKVRKSIEAELFKAGFTEAKWERITQKGHRFLTVPVREPK